MINFTDLKNPLPFTWEIDTCDKSGCLCVPFISKDSLILHLDSVCGPENWEYHMITLHEKNACKVGIWASERMVWKYGVNFANACKYWGIGAFLENVLEVRIRTMLDENQQYQPWHDITKYKNPCPNKYLLKKDKKQTMWINPNYLTEYINNIVLNER